MLLATLTYPRLALQAQDGGNYLTEPALRLSGQGDLYNQHVTPPCVFLANAVRSVTEECGTLGVQLLRKARAFGPARPASRSAPAACKASTAIAGTYAHAVFKARGGLGERACYFTTCKLVELVATEGVGIHAFLLCVDKHCAEGGLCRAGAEAGRRQALQLATVAAAAALFPGNALAAKGML